MSESLKLAELVAAQLARHLDDVIICPGSRNAPLSLALLARTDIRVHSRIDERSAAFCALGMARVQRRYVGVVVTSGTAVANTLPAVVEASYSHTPLVIISADRPERLQGTGASQTIEQRGIFGTFAATTQIARGEDVTLIAERFRADGQIHLNIALDVPLVDRTLPPQPSNRTTRKAPVAPVPPVVDHGEVEIDLGKNTLVIAGDEAWEVEGLEDVPTIAEPTAPAPFLPVHPAAAHIFRAPQVSANNYVVNTKVQQVIVVGHPTLHRSVLALINDPDIELVVLSRTSDFTNPRGEKALLGTSVKITGELSKTWVKVCQGASRMAADAVRETLEDPELGFSGLHVAAAVGDTLAVEDTLVLGASNPVRDASLIGLPFDGVDTYSPRGAAGIDGTVAQSIGIALATQSRAAAEWRAPRVVALLGDVTFVYDASSLLIPADNPRPENLTIVVANDNGGGIFEALEQGAPELRPSFERAFGTPHGANIADLAEAFGADYRETNTAQELLDTLAELKEYSTGITIVEAHTTRSTRRALSAALAAKVGQ